MYYDDAGRTVATVAPNGVDLTGLTTQPNLVVNPSFEEGGAAIAPDNAIPGWLTSGPNSNADYTETHPGAHSGSYHGSHYRPEDYEVYTYQRFQNLNPGLYILRAWVKGSGGQYNAEMQAKGYGGPLRTVTAAATVNKENGEWALVEIPNIQVSNGQCEIGFYSKAKAGQWLYFDDVEFIQQPSSVPTTPNYLLNPGFELAPAPSYNIPNWQTIGHDYADYTEEYPGAYGGTYHASHYHPNSYELYTYQVAPSLPTGRYTLRAWVKSSGGQETVELRARNYGGANLSASIPESTTGTYGPWTLVEIRNIQVINGQCEVGFYSKSPGEKWLYIDDLSLTRQPNAATATQAHIIEAGFEKPFGAAGGWQTQAASAAQAQNAYTEEYLGGHNSTRHGTHYSGSAYEVYTYQIIPNLRPGNYTFQAWVKSNGGQETAALRAKGSDGIVQQLLIPPTPNGVNGEWMLLKLEHLAVTEGQCEIGFYSKASGGGKVLYFDDAELVRESTAPGFTTRNTYNTVGNLLSTSSPDEGLTEYVYRRDGNIRFSQSARQRAEGKFSYSNYDAVGRVVESGEYQMVTNNPSQGLVFQNHLTTSPATNSVLQTAVLEDRTRTGGLEAARCSQVNRVWCDLPFTDAALNGRTQEFVLGSVAKTSNGSTTTWYSYDELSRLTWLVQEAPGVGVKTVEYQYDFNGNVLEVAYQKNQSDAFYHYYEYDADQRLRRVFAGKDMASRTVQARYEYYLHGPLKRVELADRLQGIDYTYTVQGWLKSINHPTTTYDPGQDTPTSNGLPKDLFALSLDYFAGDYQSKHIPPITPTLDGTRPVRYDGSVRDAVWRTAASADRHLTAFTYDPKGQLLQADYGKLLPNTTTFQPAANQAYEEGAMNYDPNGNLQRIRRRDGAGFATDDFNYHYTGGTNKLAAVHNQSGTAVLDYDYDATGQLVRQRDEQGQRYLSYDVTGKVTGVYRDAARQQPVVTYAYDDRGFRASKASYVPTTGTLARTTYYVRDAAGNVLSTYEQAAGAALQRTEVPLYGSGRVGMLTRLEDGSEEARYELNDQLGNARVVFHKPTVTRYLATMEPSQASQEEAAFTRVAATRREFHYAHTGTHVAELSSPGQGPGKILTVEKGDTITFSAEALHLPVLRQPRKERTTSRLLPFLVAGAVEGTLADDDRRAEALGQPVHKRTLLSRLAVGVSWLGWSTTRQPTPPTSGVLAWLHYKLKDANGQLLDEQYEPLDPTITSWQHLVLGVRVPAAGTLEVAVESQDAGLVSVFFDQIEVQQESGMIVQEQHQYAYGAPLTGLNYVVGTKRYRHGYQGQYAEKDEETGWESFELRLYDSRVGRWLSPDPEGQFDSPFIGMGNNPVSGVDPDGGFVGLDPIYGGMMPGVTVVGHSAQYLSPIVSMISSGISGISSSSVRSLMVARQDATAPMYQASIGYTKTYQYDPGTINLSQNSIFHPNHYSSFEKAGQLGFDLGSAAQGIYGIGKIFISPKSISELSKVTAEGAVWAQTTFNGTFSKLGMFSGQTVEGVAGALRSGTLSAANIPINVVVRNGQTFILNTRSSAALMRAGIPRSAWNVVNQTGVPFFESSLTGQLGRNSLINGTNTIRQSGTQLILSH